MDPEIQSALEKLLPSLNERQRSRVIEVVDSFSVMESEATKKLTLRYLQKVESNPKSIGFNPDKRACGCENGFQIIDDKNGRTPTVTKCLSCSKPKVTVTDDPFDAEMIERKERRFV
jgi:hypothetical protein